MAEGGTTEEYQKFINNPSRNMDDTGFFSIEVIIKALKVWNLEVINYNSKNEIAAAARIDPTSQNAYICNFKEHWFCVRKIGKQYFNLNSLLSHPELLSTSYISLFLAQLQQEGYSIFIITGQLPSCQADEILSDQLVTQVIKPQIISNDGLKMKIKTQPTENQQAVVKQSTSKDDVPAFEKDCINLAIEQSLLQSNKDDDKHLQQAISMSLNMQDPSTSTRKEPSPVNSLDGLTEEQLLERAIKMSMEN